MRSPAPSARQQPQRGFSLLELLIAIVVVAILAGLAYPNFMGAIRKSRRAEAFNAMAAVQQAQERWRSNNAAYSSDLTSAAPTGLGQAATTSGGLYTIALANTAANTYDVTATANSGTTQAADKQCAKLGVRMSAGTLTYAGTGSSGTLSYAATNACWSR